jgi:hypothetical protein
MFLIPPSRFALTPYTGLAKLFIIYMTALNNNKILAFSLGKCSVNFTNQTILLFLYYDFTFILLLYVFLAAYISFRVISMQFIMKRASSCEEV